MAEICDIVEVNTVATSMVTSILADLALSESATDSSVAHVIAYLFNSSAAGSSAAWDELHDVVNTWTYATTTITSSLTTKQLVSDSAQASSSVRHVIIPPALESEALAEGSVLPAQIVELVRDAAAAVSAVLQSRTTHQLVIDTATGKGEILLLVRELVESAAAASTTVLQTRTATELVEDAAQAVVTILQRRTATELAQDTAQAVSLVIAKLIATELVTSDADAESFAMDGRGGAAWSAATMTFGMSRFENPYLESIAKVGDYVAATGPEGGYVMLAGGSDAGKGGVDSMLVSGLSAMGTEQLKRPSYAYVTYAGPEPLTLFLGETGTGIERTFQYAMEPRATPPVVPTPGRYRPGQGIRALYLRVTLRNMTGEPFRVTGFRLTALDASRKI